MIKLKELLNEGPERDTKEFIKTLRRVKSSLGVFERGLDLYREPNRSIGEDYWWVHKVAMNSLEAGIEKLQKTCWKKSKAYGKKYASYIKDESEGRRDFI